MPAEGLPARFLREPDKGALPLESLQKESLPSDREHFVWVLAVAVFELFLGQVWLLTCRRSKVEQQRMPGKEFQGSGTSSCGHDSIILRLARECLLFPGWFFLPALLTVKRRQPFPNLVPPGGVIVPGVILLVNNRVALGNQ